MNSDPWFSQILEILKELPQLRADIGYIKETLAQINMLIAENQAVSKAEMRELKSEIHLIQERLQVVEKSDLLNLGYETKSQKKLKDFAVKVGILSGLFSLAVALGAAAYKLFINAL